MGVDGAMSNTLFDWAAQRVLVSGGAGFLGRHVLERLREVGCQSVVVPRSSECDLRQAAVVERVYQEIRPTVVLHLAAVVGGIGANAAHPGRFFYDNAIMGLLMMEFARRMGVAKFVGMGTICSYPKFTPTPFREEDIWNGYPEETNAPYGLAKKMLLVQAQSYRQEYGVNAITLFPTNLYGPGDNFDLDTSHVIPALIRRCVAARDRRDSVVTVWGSGHPSREFLYVKDAAEAIVLAAERYNSPEPINIGSGKEVRISALAEMIAGIVGFRGSLVYDASRPDGQPRRHLDVTRAERCFGFVAATPLEEGLRETVAWYLRQRAGQGEGGTAGVSPHGG